MLEFVRHDVNFCKWKEMANPEPIDDTICLFHKAKEGNVVFVTDSDDFYHAHEKNGRTRIDSLCGRRIIRIASTEHSIVVGTDQNEIIVLELFGPERDLLWDLDFQEITHNYFVLESWGQGHLSNCIKPRNSSDSLLLLDCGECFFLMYDTSKRILSTICYSKPLFHRTVTISHSRGAPSSIAIDVDDPSKISCGTTHAAVIVSDGSARWISYHESSSFLLIEEVQLPAKALSVACSGWRTAFLLTTGDILVAFDINLQYGPYTIVSLPFVSEITANASHFALKSGTYVYTFEQLRCKLTRVWNQTNLLMAYANQTTPSVFRRRKATPFTLRFLAYLKARFSLPFSLLSFPF